MPDTSLAAERNCRMLEQSLSLVVRDHILAEKSYNNIFTTSRIRRISSAETGQLLFIVAGPRGTQTTAPYLKGVMGRDVVPMGEYVSKASLMKISG
jgi:hypothetical protein